MSTAINELRLKRLTLKNFKGIRNFTFEPDGQSVVIRGKNESGKTTLNDAFVWLLTDKDSQNRTAQSFGIKTLSDGVPESNLEHMAEAEFANGLILKKVFQENWVQKRGRSESVLQGHTVSYFFDEVEVLKKEYDAKLAEIVDPEVMKQISMIDFFPSIMDWQDRRKVLFEMAGDVTVEEIIQEKAELGRIPELLDGKDEEDRKKFLKQQRKNLTEKLKGIPERKDELTRLMVDIDPEQVAKAKEELKTIDKKVDDLKNQISEVKTGGAVGDLRNEIKELEGQLIDLRNAHSGKVAAALKEAREAVQEAENEAAEELEKERGTLHDLRKQKQDKLDEYQKQKFEVERLTKELNQLNKDLEDTEDLQPEADTGPAKCPTCKRPMDEEHSYEDYVKEFNSDKAEKIKTLEGSIKDRGGELKVEGDKLQAIKEEGLGIEEQIKAQDAAIEKVQEQHDAVISLAKTELETMKSQQPDLEDDEEYKSVQEKITEKRDEIDRQLENKTEEIEKLRDQISDLVESKSDHESVLRDVENNATYDKRIKELTKEQNETSNKLEEVENDLFLIEQFIAARAEHVTEKVNRLFDGVTWKLFEEQINGGIKEICEAVGKNGVPFNEGLNTAGKVQAGVNIINTLTKHYGVSMPLFIDNRESVTELPYNDMQVISLIVDPEHPKLNIELLTEEFA